MALESSGVSLTSTFFMRNFYSNNRSAFKTSSRRDFTYSELSFEDATALHRAARHLTKYSYSGTENKENIMNSIHAMVDTYNNTLDSAGKSSNDSTQNYIKQLKSLSSRNRSDLDDIGITVEKNGRLKLSDNLLKSADLSSIKKALGKNSDFSKQLKNIAKRMRNSCYNDVYTEATGNGTNINLTL